MPTTTAKPRLQTGDRLSRDEFERRYHHYPELKKAELIDGVVHVTSPDEYRQHGEQRFRWVGWIGNYTSLGHECDNVGHDSIVPEAPGHDRIVPPMPARVSSRTARHGVQDAIFAPSVQRLDRVFSGEARAGMGCHSITPWRFRHDGIVPHVEASPHFSLRRVYVAYTRGTTAGSRATIRLDPECEMQPDVHVMILPEYQGQARINEDDYIQGAPELVAEVAASSVSYDLHNKLRAYRRNGVREYVVWRVDDQAVDWFVLEAGEYRLLAADEAGTLRSRCFPGLWLDVPALLVGRLAQVFETVQRGVATPEHAAFLESLAQRRTSP